MPDLSVSIIRQGRITVLYENRGETKSRVRVFRAKGSGEGQEVSGRQPGVQRNYWGSRFLSFSRGGRMSLLLQRAKSGEGVHFVLLGLKKNDRPIES